MNDDQHRTAGVAVVVAVVLQLPEEEAVVYNCWACAAVAADGDRDLLLLCFWLRIYRIFVSMGRSTLGPAFNAKAKLPRRRRHKDVCTCAHAFEKFCFSSFLSPLNAVLRKVLRIKLPGFQLYGALLLLRGTPGLYEILV